MKKLIFGAIVLIAALAFAGCNNKNQKNKETENEAVETAVEEMDDEKIVFYKDYGVDTSAANGHPNAEAQRTWGLSLAEYILQLSI